MLINNFELTTLGQRIAGTAHGGWGQAGGGLVALSVLGAHLFTDTGASHLINEHDLFI